MTWLVTSLATFQNQNQAHALPPTEDTGLVLTNVIMMWNAQENKNVATMDVVIRVLIV